MGTDCEAAVILEALHDEPERVSVELSTYCSPLADGSEVFFGVLESVALDGEIKKLGRLTQQAVWDSLGFILVDRLNAYREGAPVLWQCLIKTGGGQSWTASSADILGSLELSRQGTVYTGARHTPERWGQIVRSGWIDGEFRVLLQG